ncbi:Polyphenol oxidase B, chloroplastic [Capsicum annuum]|uniref:polyphenol oxidase B, chloroplastic n=1 Tax=Capsicum annuum TaxID=4072 RepID=UPI0007BFAE04|nr:polyphenol oxidase B, chloroplastic [Capsicum annuum]KAF3636190.1 Polyphenol oxidase B, chloroplastic [Capsicum annuum]KAF3656344.1 Polyphenol oxidase B, chloroplastic [Capsicum annuum]
MASVCNSSTTLNTPFTSSTMSFSLASTPKPSQLFLRGKRNQTFKVSCKISSNDDQNVEINSVDRRNVLLGLGGLYGVANAIPLAASATPVPAPDLTTCSKSKINRDEEVPYLCCAPKPDDMSKVPYYKFPSVTKLRIRQPAHAADEEYIAKYSLAIRKMKDLDKTEPSNPIGFKQQANIHCAYCNGAYKIDGKELQVHNSWLFFPFHRWYLYFYERILGSLIDDPTFALPYWNWDHPKGMRFPPMFDRQGTALYDERRNQQIHNGTVLDLGSFGDKVQTTQLQLMANNLTLMYRQMVTNAPCPLLFFGAPYVLGNNVEAPGTIEIIPHGPVHVWTGTAAGSTLPGGGRSHGEDMGNFYSAGLDPVFYCHHSNVDRMWSEWKSIGGKRTDLTQKDWLNSEFFFYDENKNPFRVKVRDCLDTKKMGYDYAPMPTPWRNFKPKRKTTDGKVNIGSLPPASKVFPLTKLDKPISFSINRPASSRTQQAKNEQEEMLTLFNIKFDNRQHIRFDVFLNVDKNVNADELDKTEFAGSYTSLPHVHGPNQTNHIATVVFQLAITELLEDIGLEDENTIAVTLVPRKGGEGISIGGVEINLASC